jgi:LPPG:FO 2-phospho-L-lactate transferase
MCDEPVRTWVRTDRAGWQGFQEFMIRERAAGAPLQVEYRGIERARPSQAVLERVAGASAIVIGPSNPIASIGPILAVPGLRDALDAAPASVVAVSPIVAGEVLKGPTAAFLAHAGVECSASGVAEIYGGLLDGVVADEDLAAIPCLRTDTRMDDAPARARLARETIAFAESLARPA